MRKIVGVVGQVLGWALLVGKFVADWIGRSTIGDDAGLLWTRSKPVIEFLQNQPALVLYGVSLALVLVSLALLLERQISTLWGGRRGEGGDTPPNAPINPDAPSGPGRPTVSQNHHGSGNNQNAETINITER